MNKHPVTDKAANSTADNARVAIRIKAGVVTPLEELRLNWQQYLLSFATLDEQTFREAPAALGYDGSFSIEVDDIPVSLPYSQNANGIFVDPYILNDEEVALEELEPSEGEEEWTAACENWSMPHEKFEGLWESLHFENNIKRNLENFAKSALVFADKGVSTNMVNMNRLLLCYGAPGTGKTSLCRALAQRLAIRLKTRYSSASLLDIHSHSLFSKWFSTSGKLIHRLFDLIKEMAQEDSSRLLFVLIDEVESLASSRSGLQSSGEPTDAVRAVNSLLTSLDRLKHHPNVLVLATTNITQQVDPAFIDRVDVKLYIGPPCLEARYEIFLSCLRELQRVGIVAHQAGETCFQGLVDAENMPQNGVADIQLLRTIAQESAGLSGRCLRRLPLKAHALFSRGDNISLHIFLKDLEHVIRLEITAQSQLLRSAT